MNRQQSYCKFTKRVPMSRYDKLAALVKGWRATKQHTV